jgi:hypothetical protein
MKTLEAAKNDVMTSHHIPEWKMQRMQREAAPALRHVSEDLEPASTTIECKKRHTSKQV